MRKTRLAVISALAVTAGLSSASAQTPAPTAPPPASTTPPPATTTAPVEPPPPPSSPTTPAEPVSGAAIPGPAAAGQPAPGPDPAPPPAEPAAEEESFPAAWFRIDSDIGGLQLWAGATHMMSDTVGIATDMYVNSGTLGEFDIGPSIVAGPMYITPMIGLQVNWLEWRAVSLVPQLYITGGPDPLYMELWVQNYANTVFDEDAGNTLYFRFFIDYKIGKYFGVGPEIEALLGLNDAAKPNGETLQLLPVGLNLMFSNYGRNNVLYVFAGYETQDTPGDNHFAGRLTFVHNF
jgi:hypothetical protein